MAARGAPAGASKNPARLWNLFKTPRIETVHRFWRTTAIQGLRDFMGRPALPFIDQSYRYLH